MSKLLHPLLLYPLAVQIQFRACSMLNKSSARAISPAFHISYSNLDDSVTKIVWEFKLIFKRFVAYKNSKY